MQISQFARIAQNYAIRVSEFVRKTIGRFYGEPNAISNAVDCAKFRSRSDDAVILGHNSPSDRKVRSSRIPAKNGAVPPGLDAAARR